MHQTPPDHIEIIARALIIRSGSILLCENLKNGYFYLPGGHVEPGESSPDACAREILEELKLCARIGPCRLIAEQRFEQNGKPRHEISLVFHVEHLTRQPGKPCPDSGPMTDQDDARGGAETLIPDDLEIRSAEDHIGFVWVGIGEIGSIDLRPWVIRDWITETNREAAVRFVSG